MTKSATPFAEDRTPQLPGDERALTAAGRHAAGEDPKKRDQILEGAKRVFMTKGFDAASMNDITREAGVSKGTIYVYFENKEVLFSALISRERGRMVERMKTVLSDDGPIETVLSNFGHTFARHLTAPDTIRAMRMVIGVLDRMPNLSRNFFTMLPENPVGILDDYLKVQVGKGLLVIEDPNLAARQFMDMCTGWLFKKALMTDCTIEPTADEVERVVRGALSVFLAAYRPRA